METKQTLKNCSTQKLFILNEVAKTIDLNLFYEINLHVDNEQVELIAKYNYRLNKLLEKTYGKPQICLWERAIHLIYESETATFVIIIQTL